mgnify:CR=1 FL=1
MGEGSAFGFASTRFFRPLAHPSAEMARFLCPFCGMENVRGALVCGFCGGDIRKFSVDLLPEKPAGPTDPGELIVSLIDSRDKTDRKMSKLWAVIPIGVLSLAFAQILSIMQIISFSDYHQDFPWMVYVGAGSYLIGLPLFGVFFGVMVYKMVNRTNLHTKREDSLRAATMAYLRGEAASSGKEQQVMDELLRMSAFDGQALSYEKKHNPAKWAAGIALVFLVYPMYFGLVILVHVLIDAPIEGYLFLNLFAYGMRLGAIVASAYIVNFLMRTIYTHDQRWSGFTTTTMMALHRLGKTDSNKWDHEPLKERSMILYAVLAIVTAGLFLLYWFYVLVDDPNRHFEQQHLFEDMLAKVVRQGQ